MNTAFDWITIVVFCGVVVLFLERSAAAEVKDRMLDYLPAAAGCAMANYLGNHGWPTIAGMMLLATLAYVILVLRPFARP